MLRTGFDPDRGRRQAFDDKSESGSKCAGCDGSDKVTKVTQSANPAKKDAITGFGKMSLFSDMCLSPLQA